MAEDMNLLQEEVMKPSRVFKTAAVVVNKELNTITGDQHRRRHHHVSHRAEPSLITPPQTTNNKQMSLSRSSHLHHHHHHQQTIRAKIVSSNNSWSCTEGRSSLSGKQRGRERERERGGGGMQAFFLDSGKRSSSGGTGVFLPQTNLSSKSNNIKPACAPVLLPSRVVQALKLNVHSLGVQISPRQVTKDRATSLGDSKMGKNIRNNGGKKETKTTTECGRVVSPTRSSPDIFLPKEWTY